jgi:hypothetical protein
LVAFLIVVCYLSVGNCCWLFGLLSGVGCRVLTVDCRVSTVDGCNRLLVVWFRLWGVGSKLSDVGVVCRLLLDLLPSPDLWRNIIFFIVYLAIKTNFLAGCC